MYSNSFMLLKRFNCVKWKQKNSVASKRFTKNKDGNFGNTEIRMLQEDHIVEMLEFLI